MISCRESEERDVRVRVCISDAATAPGAAYRNSKPNPHQMQHAVVQSPQYCVSCSRSLTTLRTSEPTVGPADPSTGSDTDSGADPNTQSPLEAHPALPLTNVMCRRELLLFNVLRAGHRPLRPQRRPWRRPQRGAAAGAAAGATTEAAAASPARRERVVFAQVGRPS